MKINSIKNDDETNKQLLIFLIWKRPFEKDKSPYKTIKNCHILTN